MSKFYIIAEVGSNWHTLPDCVESIKKAKETGADAVKFQLYNHKALYGFDGPPMKGELLPEWLPRLKEVSDEANIDFMCSAFSPELIDVVDPFVKAHKVASAEMLHVDMLKKLNNILKPVYLSTGAHTADEIKQALSYLDNPRVTLMYCTAAYPAKYTNTSEISHMINKFRLPVGFSDHTLDVFEAPFNAKMNGASCLEKHVNFVDAKGPDSPHSLNTDEFKHMVDFMRWGLPPMRPTPDEKDMLDTHNRRFVPGLGYVRLKASD